jgi:LPS export ABC transporter protein LptC
LFFKKHIKSIIYIAVLAFGTALFFSCREKIDFIDTTIKEDVPTQVVIDFKTSYTDSARLRLSMNAPRMEYYGRMEEPYSDFNNGLNVYFYEKESSNSSSGSITSKFARYYEAKRLWEVRDSVVAINDKGEILQTELLFWDEEKGIIYTDKYVRIIQSDQIIMGTGLESDIRFTKWVINNVSGTLALDNE